MKTFQRTIEDFTCENCGNFENGNGYTNHCSKCLYSKHVDVNPGDRLSSCFGLMEPISVEMDHGEMKIVHRCQKCDHVKRNKKAENDNFEIFYAKKD